MNKRGSFTVFAVMIMVSLIFATFSIINAAGNLAIDSTVNSFGLIWSKSILGEYDLILRDRYGLLAYYGDQYGVDEKLNKYVEFSFKEKNYISYEAPVCDLNEYCMVKPDNLRNQIDLIAIEGTKPKVEEIYDTNSVNRSINSFWIIENLPSYKKTKDIYLLGLVDKIKSGFNLESIIGNATIDKYIFSFFKDYMDDRDLGKTYFNNEVEYIITGKYSDSKIKEYSGNKIVLLRNIMNLHYLYNCQEKREGALALASTITPGAMSFITQGIILETWAYAEATNDLKLLYDNKAVALLKNDDNWALSLENTFNTEENGQLKTKETKETYVLPRKIEGVLYKDYLKMLLYGVPEETKLLRIMDLIQINMKYIYRDYFLVRDYYCGLSYKLNVNGKLYEFRDDYLEKK